MESVLQQCRSLLRYRFLAPLVTGVTLLVFAGTIAVITLQLRGRLREQIARRDAEVLHAVVLMHQFGEGDALGAKIEERADQFFVVLETSRLKDVLAARLYTADGQFLGAFPEEISEGRPAATDLARLKALRPASHFMGQARLADLFKPSHRPVGLQEHPRPLLDVLVPLHRQGQPELLGIAQFVLDGQGIATEFAQLDRYLGIYAAAAFAGGTLIVVAALVWAFRRLHQSNLLLSERTANLLNANHELALAAKTSALGTVAAHLIHGLRSPLSGLQSFVASRNPNEPADEDGEWQYAVAITHRMQAMISDVVRVLNEQDGLGQYEVTLRELADLITRRNLSAARAAGVRLEKEVLADGALVSRNANLILLILDNLIHNAVQATPGGKRVTLRITPVANGVVCEVRDEGPGFPQPLRSSLFSPCRSSKEGGSGIGLAISKQLANHLGAGLELQSSTSQGCVFALTLPPELVAGDVTLGKEESLQGAARGPTS